MTATFSSIIMRRLDRSEEVRCCVLLRELSWRKVSAGRRPLEEWKSFCRRENKVIHTAERKGDEAYNDRNSRITVARK